MAVIETMTFRLVAGADRDEFLAVDKRLQSDFAYQQPGLIRRTTARGRGDQDGEWLVIDLWRTRADADAAAAAWDDDPTAQAFMALVDRDSVDIRRYTDFG
jgi:hypothetical protein